MQRWLGCALFLATLLFTLDARATRYWVSTTGNDANSCALASQVDGAGNPTAPRKTPLQGAACLTAAGDRLTIKAGIYTGSGATVYENVVTVANGSAGNPTIIEGEGADGCALSHTCPTVFRLSNTGGATGAFNLESASYVTIRKLEIDDTGWTANDSCLRLGGQNSNVTVEDVEVHHCSDNGIFQSGTFANRSTNLVLRRINTHHAGLNGASQNPAHGCYLNGDSTLIEDSMLHDNGNGTVHNNLGCQCYSSAPDGSGNAEFNMANNCTVRRNAFYNNDGDAIAFDGANVLFYDNLVYNNLRGVALGYTGYQLPSGSRFFNNTIYGNTGAAFQCGIFAASPSSCAMSNNILLANGAPYQMGSGWTNSGVASSNKTTGTITDCTISTSDFHLKPGANACVDTGITLAEVTTDKDGGMRGPGPYDIGAYERDSVPPSTKRPSPPANLTVH